MNKQIRRLVVIPSDPIAAYERKGTSSWLEQYYNPHKFFDEVYALSPLEKGERKAYGMQIIGVHEREFRNVLRRVKPDVVRAYGGFWTSDLACKQRLSSIPVVVSVHDSRPKMLHDSVRFADLAICMTPVIAELVKARGVNPHRIRILPNRIDTNIFYPIHDPLLFKEMNERFPVGKYILHVSNKDPVKNIDTIIHSLTILPADYRCVFLGPGDPSSYIALARELDVDERCFWLGTVDNTKLPIWYSWCDCFCLPSRSEGLSLASIEASACGSAIVASDIAPIRQLLTHNQSAYLVKEYENPQALASAIRTVCEDQEYRGKLSKGAVLATRPYEKKTVDMMEVEIYRDAMNISTQSVTMQVERYIWVIGQTRIMRTARRVYNNFRESTKKTVRHYLPSLELPLRQLSGSFQRIATSNKRKLQMQFQVASSKRIDRNQWTAQNKVATYNQLMSWSWNETEVNAPAYAKRLQFSLSKANGKVLELGCGIGTMTKWLSESNNVQHIWAVDAFEEAINELVQYNLRKVTPIKMRVEELDLDQNICFDTVMICEVLEHLYPDEERKMLYRLRSHINPNSMYVISVPIDWLPDPHHTRAFTKESFVQHLKKYYGNPIDIDYSSGYSQVAWGYFDSIKFV